MKLLTNSKDWFGSRIIFSVPASLSVFGRFSSVSTPLWMLKIRVNFHVLGGLQYSMVFKDHRRVPISVVMLKIAPSEHLKRVTGRIF